MTAPRRGRGRPPLFDAPTRTRYLAARAAGATQKDAAATAGIAAQTVRNTRTRDTAFRALDDAAAERSLQVRLPHGESRYNHRGCRCPTCTKAASTARVTRPDRTPQEAHVVPINPPGQGSSSSFPAARAS